MIALPWLLSNVRLSLALNPWLYALMAAFAVAAAYIVYRYTLPPVSRWRKTILWTLRAAALLLILLLLFEPLLSYLRRSSNPPVVALLVDRSASMATTSSVENRADILRRFLASSGLKELGKKSTLRIFAFADTTAEIPPDSLSSIQFTGIGSDLAGSWSAARKMLSTENLAAAILVTDGAYNLGENPARTAQESPVPIYAIGIGDTTSRRDAVVAELITNEITYAGSRVPIDIRVRAHGLDSRTSTVRLLGRNGAVLAQQNVRFTGDDAEISAALSFEAGESGDLRVTVTLDSVAGETLLDNNRRSAIIRVLENKARVLLFSGPSSPDLTILRQSLEADTSFEVSAFVEVGPGRYLRGQVEPSAEDLRRARLIVLSDFPTRVTSDALLRNISAAASDKRIPLLFMAGSHVAASRLATLSEVLPVQATRPTLAEDAVTVRAAASHPALAGRTPLPASWSELPPILGSVGNFTVQLPGQVVAKLSRETLGIDEDEPGIALWEAGPRRGAAFLAWGTSRWKLQLAGSQSASAFYDELMNRIRAWLVAPAEEQRVKIRTTKRLYSGGEGVRFTAQVYGADLQPRDDATIDLKAIAEGRSEVVPLRSRGNGRYEGELVPWTKGEYRYRGVAIAGADTLGSDDGLFAVEAFNVELLDTRARFDILRQVAAASRGAFVPAERADSLLSRLAFSERLQTTRKEISLWNEGPLLWIVIALLAFEWIIRKRSGML